jgi:hypothetical protein
VSLEASLQVPPKVAKIILKLQHVADMAKQLPNKKIGHHRKAGELL